MHPMHSHLILLGLFLLGAKLLSLILKRPVNGAIGYLVVGGVFSVITVLKVFNPYIVPVSQRYEVLGEMVGGLLIPLGLGYWLSRRFHKKHGKPGGQEESEA